MTPAPAADELPSAREMADAWAAERGHEPSAVEARITSQRRRLRKQLVELELHGPDGATLERLVGKRYVERERGAEAFAVMRHLWRHGMGGDAPGIVRPVAYIGDRHFMLMARAPGATIHDLLLASPHAHEPVRLVARWLRRLHGIPPAPEAPAQGRARAELSLARLARELSAALPGEASRVARIAARFRRPVAEGVRARCMLHGDFHPRNVYVDGERVTVIDFDHAVAGDPAWDVGYFVGQLETAALESHGDAAALRPAADAFMDEYLRDAPEPEASQFRARAMRYAVLTLLESAHYRRCILHAMSDEAAAQLLGECERGLGGPGEEAA